VTRRTQSAIETPPISEADPDGRDAAEAWLSARAIREQPNIEAVISEMLSKGTNR